MIEGRDDDVKRVPLADVSKNFVDADVVGTDDVLITLTEIGRANVCFGQGGTSNSRDHSSEEKLCRTRSHGIRTRNVRNEVYGGAHDQQ